MKPISTDPIYAPPWHDQGQEYGPVSGEAYDRARKRYEQSRAGGGLWDEAEYVRCRYGQLRRVARDARHGLREWVGCNSHELSDLELMVYMLLYVECMSLSMAAERAGVVREHVVRAHAALLRKAGLVTGPPCHGYR